MKKKNINKKDINKKDLCKRLGWKLDSPIAAIFSTDLTDGVFDSSWSLFRDRLTWLRETLSEITKVNNVNWLVKPHPNDEINKVITSTISEVEKICSNCNYIKLFPNDITTGSIPKFIDVAITISGHAQMEYPCFGIPAITTCEAVCSGLGFTIEPQTKEEYFFQLQNIKGLKRLNNQQIELAKIFIFLSHKLSWIPVNLMASHATNHVDGTPHGTIHVDEKKYWLEMIKLLDQYSLRRRFVKKNDENSSYK